MSEDALSIIYDIPYKQPVLRKDSLVHFFHRKENVSDKVGYIQHDEYQILLQEYIRLYDRAYSVSTELLRVKPTDTRELNKGSKTK